MAAHQHGVVQEHQEEKVPQINELDDEQKNISNNNVVTTDPGTLSYFGDEDHNKLNIRIIDTEEIKGRILKHTSFLVESSLKNNKTVSRRYNDFKWLHNVLSIEYLCIFVPPIPQSKITTKILNKFNKEFISQRRYDLERFLNRIFNNKLLAKSQSIEVFLTQQSRTRFETQQKIIKEQLLSRNDKEIAMFIKTKCFPDLFFADNEEKQEIEDQDMEIESPADHTIYMEEIPRAREVYIRSNEKFVAMEKITRNVFKIMTNIVSEINTMNQELYGLYDIENNEKPQIMENEWQKRVEICDFIGKWRQFEQNQMCCFYKYFLLNLKYEHQDCLAILDIFVRYDIVFNKYKKLSNIKKKLTKKNDVVVKVEESGDDISDAYDDKIVNKMGNDVGVDDETEEKIKNIKLLLDAVCKIILQEQIPKLWKKKADGFNEQIDQFRNKFVQYALDDAYV